MGLLHRNHIACDLVKKLTQEPVQDRYGSARPCFQAAKKSQRSLLAWTSAGLLFLRYASYRRIKISAYSSRADTLVQRVTTKLFDILQAFIIEETIVSCRTPKRVWRTKPVISKNCESIVRFLSSSESIVTLNASVQHQCQDHRAKQLSYSSMSTTVTHSKLVDHIGLLEIRS